MLACSERGAPLLHLETQSQIPEVCLFCPGSHTRVQNRRQIPVPAAPPGPGSPQSIMV